MTVAETGSAENNLTFANSIVKLHTTDALEGHVVVVLERTGGGGEAFRYQLAPGHTPPKPPLSLMDLFRGGKEGPAFVAFAVTDNRELRTNTSVDVTTDDQKHTFSVVIDVAFRVETPRIVVARRNDDPLRRIQQEIGTAVARDLAQRNWSEIRNEFRKLEDEVVAQLLNPLRKFASTYGLWIERLSLTCRLGEQDMRLIQQEIQAEHATESAKIQIKQSISLAPLQATVKAQERQELIRDAAAAAAAEAIRNVPNSIHNVAELVKGIETFARYTMDSSNVTRKLIEDGGDGDPVHPAALLVADMLVVTEKLALTLEQKRTMQAEMLHLFGEALRDVPDERILGDHRRRIMALGPHTNVNGEEEPLDRFTDVESLRAQLV